MEELLDCWHNCKKNVPYKNCDYCLPDDETMRFETCRRRQKSKYNINFKSVHFVGLCCTISKKIINFVLLIPFRRLTLYSHFMYRSPPCQKVPRSARQVQLWVLYGSQTDKPLFPHIKFTDGMLQTRGSVLTAWHGLGLYAYLRLTVVSKSLINYVI